MHTKDEGFSILAALFYSNLHFSNRDTLVLTFEKKNVTVAATELSEIIKAPASFFWKSPLAQMTLTIKFWKFLILLEALRKLFPWAFCPSKWISSKRFWPFVFAVSYPQQMMSQDMRQDLFRPILNKFSFSISYLIIIRMYRTMRKKVVKLPMVHLSLKFFNTKA